ncbi:hypothetical protein MMC30_007340 [Trapelia coarctata]|nr:hypothetical protein [Trapelia coarctata]
MRPSHRWISINLWRADKVLGVNFNQQRQERPGQIAFSPQLAASTGDAMPLSIIDALQVISGASREAIQPFQTHEYYHNARRKLSKTNERDRVDALLQGLCDILPSVKQIVDERPDKAVGVPLWREEDARFIDIKIARGKCKISPTQKIRAHLAHRSLALEFKDWETGQNLVPRVVIVAENLLKAEARNGNSSRFLQSKGYPGNGQNALVHGNKILVAEQLSGTRAVSLLLIFQYSTFSKLTYNKFPLFLQKLPDVFKKLIPKNGDADGDNDGDNGNNLGENDESDEEDQRTKRKLEEMEKFLDTCQQIYNRGVDQNSEPPASETASAGQGFDLPPRLAKIPSTQTPYYSNATASVRDIHGPPFRVNEVLSPTIHSTVQDFGTGESTTQQEGGYHDPTAANALLLLRRDLPVYSNTDIGFSDSLQPNRASAAQPTQQHQMPGDTSWVSDSQAYHTSNDSQAYHASNGAFSSTQQPANTLYSRLLDNRADLNTWSRDLLLDNHEDLNTWSRDLLLDNHEDLNTWSRDPLFDNHEDLNTWSHDPLFDNREDSNRWPTL